MPSASTATSNKSTSADVGKKESAESEKSSDASARNEKPLRNATEPTKTGQVAGTGLCNRRNLLELPPSRRGSTIYSSLLASTEDGVGTDSRSQDELVASPTYKSSIGLPHNKNPDMPLYALDQVPYYLRDNTYITKYYRAYYSTRQCLRSLFYIHNETINIWTHLLGGLLFIALGVYLFVTVLIPEYKAGNGLVIQYNAEKTIFRRVKAMDGERRTTWPLWIFGFYSFSCLMCMACSTFFHLFLGHFSERFYAWIHACDYFGITFLVVGSFLPFCFYVFACSPEFRNLYISMICALGAVGLLGPFFRKWTSTTFSTKKILFYVLFVGSGLLPITHIYFLPHGAGLPYVSGLVQMMLLYGVGVTIYTFKVPEIFFPGRFDRFGSSHQWWHLCVLGAALTHFINCVRMYADVDLLVCDASTAAA